MASIRPVRTPTDFGYTFAQSYAIDHWFAATTEGEPQIRRLLAEVFDDLQYISQDEPGLVSSYLDGLEDPLRRLGELGPRIFAVAGGLTYDGQTPEGRQPLHMSHTRYVVAVASAAVAEEPGGTVHMLAAGCPEAAAAIATERTGRAWPSAEAVEADLEGAVPWCPTCGMYAVEQRRTRAGASRDPGTRASTLRRSGWPATRRGGSGARRLAPEPR